MVYGGLAKWLGAPLGMGESQGSNPWGPHHPLSSLETISSFQAGDRERMAKLVTALDLKSSVCPDLRVRVPFRSRSLACKV